MARFYKCAKCGSVILKLGATGANPECCDENMQELIPNTVEASNEKHIPVVKEEGNKIYVQIGSVIHPMAENHYIEWVYLLTDKGAHIKYLRPGDEPKVVFDLGDDEVALSVYGHCNLHGLWKADVE